MSRWPRSGSDSGDSVSPAGGELPRGPVELLEVGELERGDHARAPFEVRFDPPVVHAHEVVVGGEPHVALDAVGPVVEGLAVGAQGVLGLLVAGAAVGDDERAVHHRRPGQHRPLLDVHP